VTHRFTRRLVAVVLAGSLIGAAACSDDDEGDGEDTAETTTTTVEADATTLPEGGPEAVAANYADIVFASYSDVIAAAEGLRDTIDAFVAAPSEEGLAAAKQAWLDGRLLYGPTEAFRFYDGPIDDPEDGPEGQINAWPLDEAYIDYVVDDPTAGIVNDVEGVPELTTEVLIAANEEGGETNIAPRPAPRRRPHPRPRRVGSRHRRLPRGVPRRP
jgi:uncharacterized iron-regulated protein